MIRRSLLGAALAAILTGAVQSGASNFTTVEELKGSKTLTDQNISFVVKKKGKVRPLNNGPAVNPVANDSILLGYPTDLIGESHMFGGVIIRVSDREDEAMGNLKLSQLVAPIKTSLINTTEKQALVLKGHYHGGKELDTPKTLMEIPITEVDVANKTVFLDMSALGRSLDIAYILTEQEEEYMQDFQHLGSRTVAVDFSLKALVFDVESDYVVAGGHGPAKYVTLTTRWFLRLTSMMNPFFESRKPTPGVGYFLTNYPDGLITRFSINDLRDNPVKYYVKNVPLEFRGAILSGFEDWNHKLQDVLGHDLITYEFIDENDPRHKQIVTGDPRYNVLEWDVDNKASYGGLGPSLENSISGEIMAAQTLIQGPTIVGIYREWFKVRDQADQLRANHMKAEAAMIEARFAKRIAAIQARKPRGKAVLNLNGFAFEIPSQDPRLQDPLTVNPLDYLQTPEGYTYENYMNGYWREIVAHELGHNLGLRHNFRGNLKDTGENRVGSASWSIMEYLPRTHRHLNRVSEYDTMAIAYGYLGRQPEHLDRYCTDEDQGIYDYRNSAECSNGDATDDPISFLEERINRGLDLLLNRGSEAAPEWTISDAWGTMGPFFRHYAAYAYTAPVTATTWTNFFGKEGRPTDVAQVPSYILGRLNALICGSDLDEEVARKSNKDAQAVAAANLQAYRSRALSLLKQVPSPWTLVTRKNFSCYAE